MQHPTPEDYPRGRILSLFVLKRVQTGELLAIASTSRSTLGYDRGFALADRRFAGAADYAQGEDHRADDDEELLHNAPPSYLVKHRCYLTAPPNGELVRKSNTPQLSASARARTGCVRSVDFHDLSDG
jgi:hypothetical protein